MHLFFAFDQYPRLIVTPCRAHEARVVPLATQRRVVPTDGYTFSIYPLRIQIWQRRLIGNMLQTLWRLRI